MEIRAIDAALLKKCFLAGTARLEANKEYINQLNVFPVPDGDTGINMTMTLLSAVNEVNALENPTMKQLCKAIASGSLRGARGNSGVILSQLLRGFTRELQKVDEADPVTLAASFQRATDTAYRAVMKPKEGTILTVARGGAEKALELATTVEDVADFMAQIIAYMEEVLEHTPDLLPVLKEAGVIDSGGKGLVTILEGAYDALIGKEISLTTQEGGSVAPKAKREAISTDDIKFGYCTEFIILLPAPLPAEQVEEFKGFLESMGDSIVMVADEELVKVHVHTNDPGRVLSRAVLYGELSHIKIDNMREEHRETLFGTKDTAEDSSKQNAPEKKSAEASQPEHKKYGFISVSMGEGLGEIFKGLGVDYLLEGGQTMNPSTEDMLKAISHVNADHIFLLPNNTNVILAARQAAKLVKKKDILVIPSTTIPQGITAVINFMADRTPKDNLDVMTQEMKRVRSGEVTYAIRDTSVDGKHIAQGDLMGIGDDTILSVGKNLRATTLDLIEQLMYDEAELISLYYGAEVTEAEAEALAEEIGKKYPQVDIEAHAGGQPIYYYILSIE